MSREIDRKVAEALGWTNIRQSKTSLDWYGTPNGMTDRRPLPMPSIYNEEAIRALSEVCAYHAYHAFLEMHGNTWYVRIENWTGEEVGTATDIHLCAAICNAICNAVAHIAADSAKCKCSCDAGVRE